MPTITLTGHQGSQQKLIKNPPRGTQFDLRKAKFTIHPPTSGGSNAYPLRIDGGGNLTILGGEWDSKVSQTTPWGKVYKDAGKNGNSAAILLGGQDEVLVQGLLLDGPWDGVRPRSHRKIRIFRVWSKNGRDDALAESDNTSHELIIEECFCDNGHMAISTDPGKDSAGPIDGLCVVKHSILSLGMKPHADPAAREGGWFKTGTDRVKYRLEGNVLAFTMLPLGNAMKSRTAKVVRNLAGTPKDNLVLLIGHDQFPTNHPFYDRPGFRCIAGKEAEKLLKDRVEEWKRHSWAKRFEGFDGAPTEPIPVPDPTPPIPPDPDPTPEIGPTLARMDKAVQGLRAGTNVLLHALPEQLERARKNTGRTHCDDLQAAAEDLGDLCGPKGPIKQMTALAWSMDGRVIEVQQALEAGNGEAAKAAIRPELIEEIENLQQRVHEAAREDGNGDGDGTSTPNLDAAHNQVVAALNELVKVADAVKRMADHLDAASKILKPDGKNG